MWEVKFFVFGVVFFLVAAQSSKRESDSSPGKAASKVSSEKFKKKKAEATTFDCPYDYGLYANPDTCRRFYSCHAGTPHDTPCPSPLYFDDLKKTCVFKSEELTCGPVDLGPEEQITPDPLQSPPCDPKECHLPDCFCSSDGTLIPKGIPVLETPMMVILAFNGAVNAVNFDPFTIILNETRINPNGCPIKATFFVPHDYTSYYHIQKLYSMGHEIGMQTISQREPETWWATASTDNWVEEVIGMKEMLHHFANISRDELIGVRAPYLMPGGNKMMSMIYDYGLDYDSSIAAPASSVPLWPYTLDFALPHACINKACPTRSFPGIWEFPLNTMFLESGRGSACPILDQCVFPNDPEEIFDFLYENFLRHFATNRAPMIINMHVNYLMEEPRAIAVDAFIEYLLGNSEVWFVTMQQAMEWLRNPTLTVDLLKFEPWKCPERQPGCNIPKTCPLIVNEGAKKYLHYMHVCGQCPERYPWLGNIRGTKEGHSVKELLENKP